METAYRSAGDQDTLTTAFVSAIAEHPNEVAGTAYACAAMTHNAVQALAVIPGTTPLEPALTEPAM
ncbi:hypothetical protein [Saccharopolyspora hattusasensis]|uniref:hypothetical protein n=1 Tax=Saccharopolyspora hattusasensis TaxID=1128679 RepID=UPI003D9595F8